MLLKLGAYSAVPRKLCYKKLLSESYLHCKFWKLSYSVEGVANFSCHCPPVIVFGVYELLNVCIGGDERNGYEVSSPKIVSQMLPAFMKLYRKCFHRTS